MRKSLIGLVMAFCFFQAYSQEDPSLKYAESITTEDLKDYLSILASDALEGRETGKRGQKMAAALIETHFKELGLLPIVPNGSEKSYFQKVPLEYSKPGEIYVKVNGVQKNNFEDIVYYGSKETSGEELLDVVFGGEGSDEELAQIDINGKAVVVYNKGGFQAWRNLRQKVQDKGAKAFFLVNTDSIEAFKDLAKQFKGFIGRGSLRLPSKKQNNQSIGVTFIAPELAAEIFGTKAAKLQKALEESKGGKHGAIKKIKAGKVAYKASRETKTIISENVLGFLEGTDKKDEVVIVTAHYDHIGRNGDQINNGADDDGSGTSSVMELAEAFAMAKKEGKGPRRSMLFMTVTGEEKGLLGSQYYVENPILPLKSTVVNLNIDMVGRVDPDHKENPNYVYLVGSNRLSTELHVISEKVNETYSNLDLDYTYNDEKHPDRIYYRSDHWNFAKNDIPIIFYFNGTHEDYHRPTDTVDKIEFDILQKRAKLVFHTAWVLANRDDRPSVDKLQDTKLEGDK
ncbi:M28 family peptidase [Fulvivirgaceae bacterium BMA10]|uniref:M28 family peptidase n=1 Tax=Splendidivirga corallicola TaxID=3051826 RepID=A0ABT8KWC8_9BACT|nr:M28 family peptidase [Fulvivirgaceae bacterium BMA10]